MKKTKAYKKVPSFWWDLEDDNLVIVESDDPKNKLVAVWKHPENDASKQIEEAEKLILKLNTGQIDYKVLSRSFSKDFVRKIYPNFRN